MEENLAALRKKAGDYVAALQAKKNEQARAQGRIAALAKAAGAADEAIRTDSLLLAVSISPAVAAGAGPRLLDAAVKAHTAVGAAGAGPRLLDAAVKAHTAVGAARVEVAKLGVQIEALRRAIVGANAGLKTGAAALAAAQAAEIKDAAAAKAAESSLQRLRAAQQMQISVAGTGGAAVRQL